MRKIKVLISKHFSNKKSILPYNSREERAKFISVIFKKYLINSVLDVGCSNKTLKQWLSDDIKYVGVDVAGQPDFRVDLEKEKLQMFSDRSFQAVVCTEVLEHIENIHEIFDELCRVSNKYIIISLPNNWVNFKFSLISGKNEQKFYGLPLEKPLDRHKWFFNYDQAFNFIKFRAERNNFNIKHQFTIPMIYNNLKFHIFNLFFKFYYKNQFRTNNLFVSSLWVLLEKNL